MARRPLSRSRVRQCDRVLPSRRTSSCSVPPRWARIDQDTTISQQLSLSHQTGSRVIRGNLLVILIDDTLLYVELLYLRAEQREGDRVVMTTSVDTRLAGSWTRPNRWTWDPGRGTRAAFGR